MPMRSLHAALVAMFFLSSSLSAQEAGAACEAAFYSLSDAPGVDIAPAWDGKYRWRRPDGTSGLLSLRADGMWESSLGWTGRSDGILVDLRDCAGGEIRFASSIGRKVVFETKETNFDSAGISLAGRLVMPPGRGKVPIVALVHGSEDSSALRFFALQRLLPAQGIAVFVYDKRGTGRSDGNFTHNLSILAADASAALKEARALAGKRAGRIGYYGTSQGGWTVPLAATRSRPDFIMIGYGLAVSPIEEDREALTLDMVRHGYGPSEIAKALEIGSAAEAIVQSNFESGYDALRAVRDKYLGEPWFQYVRGNVTGIVLQTPEAELRARGPVLFAGLDPDHDPMPVLRALRVPQLWILAGQDIDAPPEETRRRLLLLRSQGQRISILTYPDAEHGLYNFETDGKDRNSTRQPATLLDVLASFARGEPLKRRYADARVDR